MKYRLITIWITTLLLFSGSRSLANDIYRPSGATFTEIGVGAREIVFGRAAIAISDGAPAGYWNPALLQYVDSPSITGTYRFISTKTAIGGEVISASVAGIPLPKGKLGATFITQRIGDIYQYDDNGNYVTNFESSDYAAFISYGLQIIGPISLGVSFKYIYQGYTGLQSYNGAVDLPDEAFNVSGVGFDIGNIYRVTDHLVASIVVRGKSKIGDIETPFGTDVGFSYWREFDVGGSTQEITFAVALEQRQYRPLKLNFGLEYMFLELKENKFTARIGALNNYLEDRKSGLKFNEFSRSFALGLGGRFFYDMVQLDFAYVKRNKLLENNSFISAGIKF